MIRANSCFGEEARAHIEIASFFIILLFCFSWVFTLPIIIAAVIVPRCLRMQAANTTEYERSKFDQASPNIRPPLTLLASFRSFFVYRVKFGQFAIPLNDFLSRSSLLLEGFSFLFFFPLRNVTFEGGIKCGMYHPTL